MKGEMEQMTELEAECRHRYRVRSIREDDYGCEERPEGVWPTVLGELEDENGQLRLSNTSPGDDGKPYIGYAASAVTVKAGWNHIVIPLSKFTAQNGFDLSAGINAFRIHGCKN